MIEPDSIELFTKGELAPIAKIEEQIDKALTETRGDIAFLMPGVRRVPNDVGRMYREAGWAVSMTNYRGHSTVMYIQHPRVDTAKEDYNYEGGTRPPAVSHSLDNVHLIE